MKPLISISSVYVFMAIILLSLVVACNKNDGNNNTTPKANSVSIKGFAFNASSLIISSGTTITWTNDDAVAHTVTADDNSFNSGNIEPGATYTKTFSFVGTFSYHCTIHASMHGSVTVQ